MSRNWPAFAPALPSPGERIATQARGRVAKLAISGMIAVALAAQLVSGVIGTGRRGWPIVPYFMYATPHHDGDRLTWEMTVLAIVDGAEPLPIDRWHFRAPYPVFNNRVILPILNGNHADLEPVIREYCALSGGKLTTLRVLDNGVAITRNGPAYGLAPEVVGEVAVDCSSGLVK